jgi:hypothetical protein
MVTGPTVMLIGVSLIQSGFADWAGGSGSCMARPETGMYSVCPSLGAPHALPWVGRSQSCTEHNRLTFAGVRRVYRAWLSRFLDYHPLRAFWESHHEVLCSSHRLAGRLYCCSCLRVFLVKWNLECTGCELHLGTYVQVECIWAAGPAVFGSLYCPCDGGMLILYALA